ncbi:putative DNA repair polymerase (plasmid) [Selenomonas ruminantium subsp. lactilytica TAM6421]|uniref:Putative DNA repair polymerase n=1 Tax=Selenomonas ruminantium subsp. lactilytica (strain NBRC 103574 / TAM6421) TaxID=927704 RepID=I0GW97_SELRL|nr:DNA methylase [Selenomonas ruminantium]BAL85034.1 putative DNA repair polymerase [Selenomonas ruminantium subsp. lactilytica TAM6421]
MEKSKFIAIDLKSFYASVECMERGLDPLTTNLVVADESRTEKTICLAASPAIKKYGVPGRARLFEVVQKIKFANCARRYQAPGRKLVGESCDSQELAKNPQLAISYIVAPPRMALYMDYSSRVYGVYLRYISPRDIHTYSIDEVFINAGPYLDTYKLTAHELAMKMVREVLAETGITATAGIGTNMYLAKIAMDITAKHMPPDKDGVRIAELNEMSYRQQLWNHTPLTDFWRVGRGYAKKLVDMGLHSMGDIARYSISARGECDLYQVFGVNAELLIDHAWGYEPCTMETVKSYRPASTSLSSGQVLHCPYTHEQAKLIVWEMADQLVLDLVEKKLLTNQIVLDVGYDIENMARGYTGPVHIDHYGRKVPKAAHGTISLDRHTSSTRKLLQETLALYDRITLPPLLVRRITVTAGRLISEDSLACQQEAVVQFSLFEDMESKARQQEADQQAEKRERSLQHAMLAIKHRFGKNAILKAANLKEEARTIERNREIGGHKA